MKFNEIYVYGEILFDCFVKEGSSTNENTENKLGGAPFNVAWNLKGFGLEPKMLTSVGEDELGKEVLNKMKNWNMDTSYINIISNKQTGSVFVNLDDKGVPSYTIKDDCAYDYIDISENIDENSLLYHGSLALRNEHNQRKSEVLKGKLNSNSFVDVNLRKPWWDGSLLQTILNDLKYLKINDEELPLVCESFGFNSMEEKEQLEFILEKLDLELLILTKGSLGALLMNKNKQEISMPIEKVDKIADTVGAGDAFASVVIYGLYKSWKNEVILKRAMSFASKVCTLNGAITEDKNFYNSFSEMWEKESAVS